MPLHPIFDDIKRGDLEEVKRRVLSNATVLEERYIAFDRMTPLIYSINQCNPDIAHWIIKHRRWTDIDAQDEFGKVALHLASCKGPLSVVQTLVEAGADPSLLNEDGCTPLMLASSNGHRDIVAFLLQLPEAIIDAIDIEGDTALSCASRNGHSSIVQLLLKAGADPTIPAGEDSPLDQATREGHTATAALLRRALAGRGHERGRGHGGTADSDDWSENDEKEWEENHPVFGDIYCGDLEEVRRRVQANPAVLDKRHSDFGHKTPLIYAIYKDQPVIALWLIEHRGKHNLDTRDEDGKTALHHACCQGPLSLVQAMVAAGADPTIEICGQTPLIHAICNPDIVAYLLGLPASKDTINVIDEYGHTALSHACQENNKSTVKLLLAAGADPTIPRGEYSPLALATGFRRTAIADLVRQALADPDRVRARLLYKAHSSLVTGLALEKARHDALKKRLSVAEMQRAILAVTPASMKKRVAWGTELLCVNLPPSPKRERARESDKRVRATVAFVLGLGEGGVEYPGLPEEMFKKLIDFLSPTWAENGPEDAYGRNVDEGENDEDGGESGMRWRRGAKPTRTTRPEYFIGVR